MSKNVFKDAKVAAIKLGAIDGNLKNQALEKIAELLIKYKDDIIVANNQDLERSKAENLAMPLLKRLNFNEDKIKDVVDGIRSLINLEEPINKTLMSTELDNGLELYKVTCPIGVIGVIFESRPDALVQISTLCLKSGNAVILKGGSEAKNTNAILAKIIVEATTAVGIPKEWLVLLDNREEVNEMLSYDEYIDLIIPRGSNEFVQYIMNNSKIPVMGHADGICHCYVAEDCDIEKAVTIAVDSKTQYVAACNALETLLVNENVAKDFLPRLKEAMDKKEVELLGCEKVRDIISIGEAVEEDWKTEYLEYKLSIKIVSNMDEAIEHINTYGSGHTEVIVTKDKEKSTKFMELVDSSSVFWNCSTRFSDGFRYGFGAEVGISTGKLHARGPVGLEGLIIYKFKLIGNGDIVSDYSEHKKKFTHKDLNQEFPLK